MRLNWHPSVKLWPFEFLESFCCSISSVSICYLPKSEIRVKSYGRLNLPCASMINFKHLDILCGWIGIRVKSYVHLNFSRASVLQFQVSQYIIGLNRTSESKVIAVWILFVLMCSISSISIYCAPESDIRCIILSDSIYYWPELDIRVKSYGRLNLPCGFMFNFEHIDILFSWIRHPSQKLWPFEFALCFHV